VVVTVYSTSWCPDCTRSRRVLTNAGIEFAEIDIEKIPGAEDEMRAHNGGSGKVPTILFAGNNIEPVILIEPSDAELTDALNRLSVHA